MYITMTVLADPGTFYFHDGPPYFRERLLNQLFPEPLSAAEEMEGEVPAGVQGYNRAAGPAYSELFQPSDWELDGLENH